MLSECSDKYLTDETWGMQFHGIIQIFNILFVDHVRDLRPFERPDDENKTKKNWKAWSPVVLPRKGTT